MRLSDLPIINPANVNQPKYLQIAAVLEEYLQRANLAEGERFFSDRMLAQRFSTTSVTVAHSLNHLVSKGLLCRRRGSGTYIGKRVPDRNSRLRIGIICHEIIAPDECYVTPVLRKFSEFFDKCNCEAISFKGEPEDWRRLIREYDLAGVMIFVPKGDFKDEIIKLRQDDIPAVSIGYAMPELPGISFGTDHGATIRKAVEHLYTLGHRKIAVIYSKEQASGEVFERNYRQAMWDFQLPAHPAWSIDSAWENSRDIEKSAERFWQIFSELRQQNDLPTALLVTNVLDAAPLYCMAKKYKLNIPGDLSLIAFDDPLFSSQLEPPLTVIGQDLDNIALNAASALLAMIESRDFSKTIIYKQPELIQRGSVRKIDC